MILYIIAAIAYYFISRLLLVADDVLIEDKDPRRKEANDDLCSDLTLYLIPGLGELALIVKLLINLSYMFGYVVPVMQSIKLGWKNKKASEQKALKLKELVEKEKDLMLEQELNVVQNRVQALQRTVR